MIDAYASEPHYRDHIAPVFDALGGQRGEWRRHGTNPVIVASYKDLLGVGQRPVIFMEHGAGQTYGKGHPSYAGGMGRESVRLFLCPSERVATLNREAWPATPAVVIGCPKLQRWMGTKPTGTIGLAFHWNGAVCPETRSALPHYQSVLPDIAQRFDVIGTAHPRIARVAAKVYANAGIEMVSADEMFARAELLVCDNTSLGWEFLSLDRPVVWLNAPWYRRGVEHGMRFWEFADSGVQVNDPEDLVAGISVALADEQPERRREVAVEVYGRHSAKRGATAIVERFGGLDGHP